MKFEQKDSGVEFSLLNSWESWDEMDLSDLFFYNVKLKPEVFGEEFVKSIEGEVVDVLLGLSTSIIEVYVGGVPVLEKKVKLTLKQE